MLPLSCFHFAVCDPRGLDRALLIIETLGDLLRVRFHGNWTLNRIFYRVYSVALESVRRGR